MSQVEIYDYSPANKIISVAVPLLILGIILALLFSPFYTNSIPENQIQYWLIVSTAAPLSGVFAAAIHLMYPDVHVMGDQFKIKTRFYESPWLGWTQIKRVLLPESKLTTQVVTVSVPGIHPVYWIIGLSRGVGGPAFIIHPRMRNGQRLVRKIYNKRRDLFENSRTER